MNNMLEKKLNEYREDLKELNNDDLLSEYGFSCSEVERFRQLTKNDSDNKYLQTRFEYEKQCKRICKDVVINRMEEK